VRVRGRECLRVGPAVSDVNVLCVCTVSVHARRAAEGGDTGADVGDGWRVVGRGRDDVNAQAPKSGTQQSKGRKHLHALVLRPEAVRTCTL
jgi:hypothetical protein